MIRINDILNIPIQEINKYNVHLACIDTTAQLSEHPLNVFWRNEDEYLGWQEWKGNLKEDSSAVKRENFSRNYILSFAQVYYEGINIHLFTGVYEIVERFDTSYKCKRIEMFENLIGRLKINYRRPSRIASYLFDSVFYNNAIVHEILSEPMTCKTFPGLDKINEKFEHINTVIKNVNPQWKSILENLKGVYLLVDDSSNKKYIGSAYGEFGIWSRWSNYVYGFTGGNKGLDDLHKQVGEEHFKKFFRFVLLEYFTNKTPDEFVIQREKFWKQALNTYNPIGYNHN